nr:unnamed protein product [Spirometra erinaceieuropaei]
MDVAEIVKQSDQLHENVKLIEDYDLLKPYVETGGLEIQYRFARACRSRILNDAKNDKHKIKELTEEGLKAAELAVASNDKSPTAHMWLGIFYDLEGQLSGINKRIENAYKVRDEFQKALDLGPSDADPYHCMGVWCHEVASLGKLERAFASAFFKKPPESSYEEAVKFLLKSTELSPNKLIDTYARLAECYEKLKEKDKAKIYADIVLNWKREDDEAKEIKKRVSKLR